jgi:DNA-binding NtrC family response regulator
LNDYNRARTADALGISKKTLYLKIKRYELDVPE